MSKKDVLGFILRILIALAISTWLGTFLIRAFNEHSAQLVPGVTHQHKVETPCSATTEPSA